MTTSQPGSSNPDDVPDDETAHSAVACPRCGAHRLALLNLPQIDTTGYRPLDEAYGLVSSEPLFEEPAIGCLACGAEWPDLGAFQTEADAATRRLLGPGQPRSAASSAD